MRILIPSIQAPFIFGGAQMMTDGISNALKRHGHEVEIIRFPFKFYPESYLEQSMDYCVNNDFTQFNHYPIDMVLALQFPAYYVQHPNKTLWLMHQHRVMYELTHMQPKTDEYEQLKAKVIEFDNRELANCKKRFSMCQNVSNRLSRFNGIDSQPVYHPPANFERFICQPAQNFIFCPSRLEGIKRQDLIIKAMQFTRSNIGVIIAGEGSHQARYMELAESLDLGDKVRFIGQFTDEEKYLYYARSLAVFFGPFDEDYGYITLEAMLSAKPVITCTDSGGPLEFVVNGETGYVLEPDPEQIAIHIDRLNDNHHRAAEMGQNGLHHYHSKNIGWDHVVETLLA
jgi:glycosyltransferase involved in cell wall biosynthesis